MLQRILVPLDGSERSEQAIPIAAGIARATGGSVILLRATGEPTDLYWLSWEATQGTQDALEVRQDEIKKYIARIASSEMLEGVGTVTRVMEGAAADAILSVASSEKADLIVMSSHGYTGFKRWMLGSVAHKVAWHSTTPVLILREGSRKLGRMSLNIGQPMRALVALDGTSFTEAAAMPAAELVAACSAPERGKLHLAHLIKYSLLQEEMAYEEFGANNDVRQATLHQADHYLRGMKERLCHEIPAESAVDITWSVGECQDVAESLLRMAEGEGEGTHVSSNLIAMTTHGRGGLDRWMRGSVAERVLSSTAMPLLIVHPNRHEHALDGHGKGAEE
jgi:nucleotide-binding universal stress UspA family protein